MGTTQEYIAKQASPQKEILEKLRHIIIKNNPGIEEEMKMGVPVYGNKFYLVGLKDHVNMGFSRSGKELDSRLDVVGKKTSHKEFSSLSDVSEDEIKQLMTLTVTAVME